MLQIEQAIKPSDDTIREEEPMADGYRIFGAEMSPYSVKVRSYFRYKAIPHQWILRNAASQAEYEKHAKMPIIPLVVTPEGTGIQDSTPIIDAIEKLYPEPSIHPDDPVGRLHFRADRGIRRRVGQQMDVPLPLGARGRPDQLRRAASRGCAAPKAGEAGARRVRRPGARPHGGAGLVRRLQRGDRAADRGRVHRDARTAGQPSRDAALSVRRTAGLSAISACGARSTRCGPIRPPAP